MYFNSDWPRYLLDGGFCNYSTNSPNWHGPPTFGRRPWGVLCEYTRRYRRIEETVASTVSATLALCSPYIISILFICENTLTVISYIRPRGRRLGLDAEQLCHWPWWGLALKGLFMQCPWCLHVIWKFPLRSYLLLHGFRHFNNNRQP